MKKEKRNKFRSFIMDMVPVTMGVLIALALNNYNEYLNEKEFVGQTLEIVYEDLNDNISDYERKIVTIQACLDTLETYTNNSDLSVKQALDKRGLDIFRVKDASVKRLLGSTSKLVDYQVYSKLSYISEAKQDQKLLFSKFNDCLLRYYNSKGAGDKKIVCAALANYIQVSQGIMQRQKELIALMEKQYGKYKGHQKN